MFGWDLNPGPHDGRRRKICWTMAGSLCTLDQSLEGSPPATTMFSPAMYFASSEQRNDTTPLISSGRPILKIIQINTQTALYPGSRLYTVDLFDQFGFSCFVMLKLSTDLFLWFHPNMSICLNLFEPFDVPFDVKIFFNFFDDLFGAGQLKRNKIVQIIYSRTFLNCWRTNQEITNRLCY